MQPIPPGLTLSCASRNPSHAAVSSVTNAFVNEFILQLLIAYEFCSSLRAKVFGASVRIPLSQRTFVDRSTSMMDVVMLAIALAFFALSIGYVYACEQL